MHESKESYVVLALNTICFYSLFCLLDVEWGSSYLFS